MHKKFTNASACLVSIAALTLLGCGGGDDADGADGAGDAGAPARASDAGSSMSNPAPVTPMETVDPSSPEGVVLAFSDAMRSGDFLTAAQFCASESGMHAMLFSMAEQFETIRTRAENEPEFAGLAALAESIILSPWREVSTSELSVSDEAAQIGVTFADGQAEVFPLVMRDGQWLLNGGDDLFPAQQDGLPEDDLPAGPPAPRP